MTDEERSLAIFNQAIDMKRKGRFDAALKMYVESMRAYPEYSSNMDTFYAIGKVFYLKGDVSTAIKCYAVYNWRCVLKTMLILQDYCDMMAGDSQAQFRILDAYYNLATHWGWGKAEKGDSNQNKNEQIYRDLLMGGTAYSSLSLETKAAYDKYDALCRNRGYQYIFEHFENMIENPEQTHAESIRYTAEIFTIIERLPTQGNGVAKENISILNNGENNGYESYAPINRVHRGNHGVTEDYYSDLINLPYDSLGFDSEQDMDDFFDGINDD